MNQSERLTERFEASRGQLRAVAFRLLGSVIEADDAVQEAWLRLNRTEAGEIENLEGWLKTVVARVSLDMLRTRKSRREESFEESGADFIPNQYDSSDPERETLLADSVGLALLVVLEALAPAERVAFVLHDMFDVPFDDIAPIVGRSSDATRQLASRARRRVRGTVGDPVSDFERQREVVNAFRAAARGGDFEALLNVLDPNVVLRADGTAVKFGAQPEVRGAAAVADTFSGRAQAARFALVDGAPSLVWPKPDGTPRVVFNFTIEGDTITAIDLLADSDWLGGLEVEIVGE